MQRQARNGTGSGLGSVIGGAMFGSSMAAGGQFANSVVGAVATGNISTVGSIKGEKAAQAPDQLPGL